MLVSVQDSASSHVGPALNALKRVGATDPILVDFRGSFALIGSADSHKPAWIAQDQHPRYKGPSMISRRIPLPPSAYVIHLKGAKSRFVYLEKFSLIFFKLVVAIRVHLLHP